MQGIETAVLRDYPWIERRRLTVYDYERMGEAGILTEDDRVELIEGQIVEMSPIGNEHCGRVNRLTRLLVMLVGCHGVVGVQNPVRLSDYTEPQPDFAVLKPRPDDYARAKPLPADVLLLVELADSSLAYDRTVKQRIYASSGIQEYWVLDLTRRIVEVYRAPQGETYTIVAQFGAGETLTIPGIPGATIGVSEIFDYARPHPAIAR